MSSSLVLFIIYLLNCNDRLHVVKRFSMNGPVICYWLFQCGTSVLVYFDLCYSYYRSRLVHDFVGTRFSLDC